MESRCQVRVSIIEVCIKIVIDDKKGVVLIYLPQYIISLMFTMRDKLFLRGCILRRIVSFSMTMCTV